jgi:hypothetical protein
MSSSVPRRAFPSRCADGLALIRDAPAYVAEIQQTDFVFWQDGKWH